MFTSISYKRILMSLTIILLQVSLGLMGLGSLGLILANLFGFLLFVVLSINHIMSESVKLNYIFSIKRNLDLLNHLKHRVKEHQLYQKQKGYEKGKVKLKTKLVLVKKQK